MEAEPLNIECLRHPAEADPASTIPQEEPFRAHARGTNVPFGGSLRGVMDAHCVLLDVGAACAASATVMSTARGEHRRSI